MNAMKCPPVIRNGSQASEEPEPAKKTNKEMEHTSTPTLKRNDTPSVAKQTRNDDVNEMETPPPLSPSRFADVPDNFLGFSAKDRAGA